MFIDCRCVAEFNQTFEYSLLTFFLWDMLGLASELVTLQFQIVEYQFHLQFAPIQSNTIVFLFCIPKWDDESSLVETIALVVILFAITTCIFTNCEPGAKMTGKFEKFSDEFEKCDWYALPIELQRKYLIFLSNTHAPIKMCSYAGIVCDRDTAKRVFSIWRRISIRLPFNFHYHFQIFNNAFSYFMTFRRFNA